MKYIVTLNEKNYEVEVTQSKAVLTGISAADTNAVANEQKNAPEPAPAPTPAQNTVSADGKKVTAPMPGTILSVGIKVGQSVKAGDVLMVLEAMKMENDITAPSDGVVKQLAVSKGSTVNTDDVLAVI